MCAAAARAKGERGHPICLDQVENTRDAISMPGAHSRVDPQRIGLIDSSFGATVAVYTAGVEARVAATISSGGCDHGERKFCGQHAMPEAWSRFTAMLEEGRRHRSRTGTSLMMPRFDLVPIPPELRAHMNPSSIQAFTAETAQSMLDFCAEEVVGRIAPRPLLLLHSAADSVTPTEQSIELFKRTGSPTELHLFAETDHFMLAEDNVRGLAVVRDWLRRYPVVALMREAARAAIICPVARRPARSARRRRSAASSRLRSSRS